MNDYCNGITEDINYANPDDITDEYNHIVYDNAE